MGQNKQRYHNTLNSNQICFSVCIQKGGKVTWQDERRNQICVPPFPSNRYRVLEKTSRQKEKSIEYTVMVLFLSFIFMTTYLYLKESFQRVKKHH